MGLAPIMTTYITVCKNTILSNRKRGCNKPPIRISNGLYGTPHYAHVFEIQGAIKIVYSPDKPTPWGARVWMEVEHNNGRITKG